MPQPPVEVDVGGPVATIVLARESRANALDQEMFRALTDALERCATTSGVRAVVLSGRGRHFSAGGDLDHPVFSATDPAERRGHLEPAYDVTAMMLDSPVPIVAAVHGRCAGAATALVLASDLRVATTSATFSLDFVRLGLVPDMGVSWLLGRSIGTGRALELALTGAPVTSATALEWGLVSRVVADADHLGTGMELARSLAEHPPGGLREVRRLIREAPFGTRDEAFGAEMRAMTELIPSADTQERLHAFRTRKRPE